MEFTLIFLGGLAFALLMVILYFVPLGLWIAAASSGAYVGITTLVAMRLRRVVPSDAMYRSSRASSHTAARSSR